VAIQCTGQHRIQGVEAENDLAAVDRHRVAARVVEIRSAPSPLRHETSAQALDVKVDVAREVKIDVAHLRFNSGRARIPLHEHCSDHGDNREARGAHTQRACTMHATPGRLDPEEGGWARPSSRPDAHIDST
jgi:hypothetical protein